MTKKPVPKAICFMCGKSIIREYFDVTIRTLSIFLCERHYLEVIELLDGKKRG